VTVPALKATVTSSHRAAGMTTRHRVRCLPGTAIGVDAGERGYFFVPRRMGFGPVTALASCSAPLAPW